RIGPSDPAAHGYSAACTFMPTGRRATGAGATTALAWPQGRRAMPTHPRRGFAGHGRLRPQAGRSRATARVAGDLHPAGPEPLAAPRARRAQSQIAPVPPATAVPEAKR